MRCQDMPGIRTSGRPEESAICAHCKKSMAREGGIPVCYCTGIKTHAVLGVHSTKPVDHRRGEVGMTSDGDV